MAVVGYVQAYPLMGLVAVAMLMGVQGSTSRRFSVLGIAAHCIPLATLWMFRAPLMQGPITTALPFSFINHGTGFSAELIALGLGHRDGRE